MGTPLAPGTLRKKECKLSRDKASAMALSSPVMYSATRLKLDDASTKNKHGSFQA